MYTSYAETYSAAISRVKRAEETSDLQSEAELGRGHRRYDDQYITHTRKLKLKTIGIFHTVS